MLLLFLTSCESNNGNYVFDNKSDFEEIEDKREVEINDALGNTNSNINNGGYIVENEEYIFLSTADKVYKIRKDTKEQVEIISGYYTKNLNLYGGCLYFNTNSAIYSLNKDLELEVVLKLNSISSMIVFDNSIYCIGGANANIFKISIDSKNAKRLNSLPSKDLNIDGKYIYYTTSEDFQEISKGTPYRMNINGESNQEISSDNVEYLRVDQGELYYYSNDDKAIVKAEINATDKEVLIEGNYADLNFDTHTQSIYALDLDKSVIVNINKKGDEVEIADLDQNTRNSRMIVLEDYIVTKPFGAGEIYFFDSEGGLVTYEENLEIPIPSVPILSGESININSSDEGATEEVEGRVVSYVGRIGSYPIHMKLTFRGESVVGEYYYDKYETYIPIVGVYQNNLLRLFTYENEEWFVGTINQDKISGEWTNKSSVLRFNLADENSVLDSYEDDSQDKFKIAVYEEDINSSEISWIQPNEYTEAIIKVNNQNDEKIIGSIQYNDVYYDGFTVNANESYKYLWRKATLGENELVFSNVKGVPKGKVTIIMCKSGYGIDMSDQDYLEAVYKYENKDLEVVENSKKTTLELKEDVRLVDITNNWVYYEKLTGEGVGRYEEKFVLNIYCENLKLVQSFELVDFDEINYEDVNGDGNVDIVVQQRGTVNQPKDLFIWDVDSKEFVKVVYSGFDILSFYEIKNGYIENQVKSGSNAEDTVIERLEWDGNVLYITN